MAETKYVKNSICIYSYNSRGFSEDKQDVCRMLMIRNENHYPILCNQENFLLKGNSFRVKQCLPNTKIIFKKAEKDSLEGRPKNGMFIAIPEEIGQHVTKIETNHWRVQAITISTTKNKILLINSYFPTDPRSEDFDTTDLFSTLTTIASVIEDNEHDSTVWGGDINADFMRGTFFTNAINDFLNERSLQRAWDKFAIDFTHVFEMDNKSYTSTIDHFFWSEDVTNSIESADVLHLSSNTSDHSPIYCMLNIESLRERSRAAAKTISRPSWKKATEAEKTKYKDTLETRLKKKRNICVDKCNDVHCQQDHHRNEIDDFLADVLGDINSSAAACLPTPGKKKKRTNHRCANGNKRSNHSGTKQGSGMQCGSQQDGQ